jgi:predicted DNA-binding transcriptional regulator YafY
VNRPTGRVLVLLELLQSGGTRTTGDLADRLGVDPRTVRRYVDHLIDLEVPVETVRGRYGGYRLGAGYRLPPLMLSDDEALAVLLGLVAGRRTGLSVATATASETAAAKIRRVLPARLTRRLDSLVAALAVTAPPAEFATPDAEVLLTLADAVRHRRPVALAYTDRHGRRTDRVLHPFGVVAHAGHWYVRGADPDAGADRTFRLDRITGVRTLAGTFPAPAEFDVAHDVLTGFATAAYRYEVRIRMQGTEAEIRTGFPAGLATVTPIEADGPQPWQRLDMRVERLDLLPRLLAAADRPFVVEAPDELRSLMVAFADRLAERARRT